MSGIRAYAENLEKNTILLNQFESRHLIAARRARCGDSVSVFDLSGNAYLCKIVSANPKKAELEKVEKLQVLRNPFTVALGQAIPKGKTFDDILRQSIESGIDALFPILSENCEVKISPENAQDKRQKWLAQIVEAIKQSSNMAKFDLHDPAPLNSFFEYSKDFDVKIIASLESVAKPILNVLKESVKSNEAKIAILVGPEGDFSPSEYKAAYEHGFLPVKIGNQVMKAETAALAASSFCENYMLAMQ